MVCSTLLYFSTFCNKQLDFQAGWGDLLNKKRVFLIFFKILSRKSLILRRIQQDIIKNEHKSSCKLSVILSHLNQTLIFGI